MNNKLNHTCIICGEQYHACDTCNQKNGTKLWQSLADTSEHYKIYMILKEFSDGILDKETARYQLKECNLKKYKTFKPNVIKTIDEIIEINEVATIEKKQKQVKSIDKKNENKSKEKVSENTN